MEAPAQEEQQTKVAARVWYGASVAEFLRLLSGLGYCDFRGDRWTNVHNTENRRYLRNACRVLLTRARQGMVIFVPPGDHNDPTRAPEYYDATYTYLVGLGLPEVH